MPRTRSQTAAGRRIASVEIVDPMTNLTLSDLAKKMVTVARSIHLVAATIEDVDPTKIGFIDAVQRSGSNAVVVARKIRLFHEERWSEKVPKQSNNDEESEEDEDDEDDEEDDIEANVEREFDEDFSLLKAAEITTRLEATAVGLIDDRRVEMERFRDPDGESFLRQFIEQYHQSIAEWDRVKETLRVCVEHGGETAIDMILRRRWLK